MMHYNARNWYWGPFGGQYYSSATQSMVAPNDATFLAWQQLGNVATPWPKDANGNVTTRSLQDVLDAYGLFVDLIHYAANARYLRETGGIIVSGMPVETDRVSQIMIANANQMAVTNASFTTKWKQADGSFIILDANTIKAIATSVGNHVAACFSKEADLVAGILSSPPTITTRDQVDQAFASVT